jgi:hypothetical protein
MLCCPICDERLETRTDQGWECKCGELIAFGMEKDDDENCKICPVRDCPRRK